MAARSNNSVLDMVHWYNSTPKYGTNSCTAHAAMTYTYSWRVPTSSKESTIAIEEVDNRYKIGDAVSMKPPVSRCTTFWFYVAVWKFYYKLLHNNLPADFSTMKPTLPTVCSRYEIRAPVFHLP